MRFKKSLLVVIGLALVLMGARAFKDNNLIIGDGANTDKEIIMDVGGGTSNPRFRWNSSTSKLQFTNNNVDAFDIGSGSGGGLGVNFIDNADFELNADGYAAYKDAAGVDPVDGTGGAPAAVTFTRTTTASELLRGDGSGKLSKAALDGQGEGVSFDFDIQPADTNKLLGVKGVYSTSSNYQTGDIGVYAYCDLNGSPFYQPVRVGTDGTDTNILLATNGAKVDFAGTFVSPADATDLDCRLIFHIKTTNGLAWDFIFDDLTVGPGQVQSGAVVTDWVTWSVTTSDFGNNDGLTWATNTAQYRQVGSSYEVKLSGSFTGTGTSGSNLVLPVPNGHTVTSGQSTEGRGWGTYVDNTEVNLEILKAGALNLRVSDVGATQNTTLNGTDFGSVTSTDIDTFFLHYFVEVSELQGKGVVNLISEQNVTEWREYQPTLTNWTVTRSTFHWRRVGDSMQIKAAAELDAAPTGDILFTLPSGYNFDANKFADFDGNGGGGAGNSRVGRCDAFVNPNIYHGQVAMNGVSTTTLSLLSVDGTNAASAWNATQPASWIAGSEIRNIFVELPIVEFGNQPSPLVGFSFADATRGGLVSSGAQEFGGEKKIQAPVDGDCGTGNICSNIDVNGTNETCTTNCDACTVSEGQYVRVGNSVSASWRISVDPTASGTFYRCDFDPFIPSDFTTSQDASGVCANTSTADNNFGSVTASAGGDTINVTIPNPPHTTGKSYVCTANFVIR